MSGSKSSKNDGGAPSVGQSRSSAGAARPYALVNRIALGIVIALLAAGLPIGAYVWGISAQSRQRFEPGHR